MSQANLCLHIGCGLVVANNWKNIDASPSLRVTRIPLVGRSLSSLLKAPQWPEAVQYGNIVKGLNLSAESCDLIYAAHVLEHLSFEDFQTAMRNIYAYLKPGGIFRAVVPDLEQYAKQYLQQRQDSEQRDRAAANFMVASCLGRLGTRQTFYHRLREAAANHCHQWMWDDSSLSAAFKQCGFNNTRQCYYGDWQDPRFAAVESEASYDGAIGIEGMK